MATVKLQDGKVVLKDGKVSCSCCEEAECCMYPAQALADGLFSSGDLPDQIVFNWAEPGGPIISTVINKSGSQYETNVGTTNLVVRIQSNPLNPSVYFWYRQVSGPLFPSADNASNPCLIYGDAGTTPGVFLIEDQFADTYTASGVPVPGGGTESVSLSRISLCVWQGVDSCGGPVLLSYDGIAEGSGGPFGTYHWYITWVEYPFFNLFGCNSTPEGYGSEKTDPQSSPAGTYEGNATITVS